MNLRTLKFINGLLLLSSTWSHSWEYEKEHYMCIYIFMLLCICRWGSLDIYLAFVSPSPKISQYTNHSIYKQKESFFSIDSLIAPIIAVPSFERNPSPPFHSLHKVCDMLNESLKKTPKKCLCLSH